MSFPVFSLAELRARLPHTVKVPAGAQPFMFGDSPDLAKELAELVVMGKKRATAGLLWRWEADDGGPPDVGQAYVVHDWGGEPLAVIENTEITVAPFDKVDAEFVAEEGEGDLSLAWWREAHWEYFARECERLGREPSLAMPVVCQRFRLLYPPRGIHTAR